MALVTIHRSPTPSNCATNENLSCDLTDVTCDVESSIRSPHRSQRSELSVKECHTILPGVVVLSIRRFSESYLAVKGAALILPQSECTRTVTHDSPRGDIHSHLQSMFYLLRSQDTIKVAVKLESRNNQAAHHRYMALVSTIGTQDLEESVILGIDIVDRKATIGLVFPIWSDLRIHLDGDGGYSVKSNEKKHIFKPVSVQAMWSSLQCLNKVQEVASSHRYLPDGLTHTWINFYQSQINSDLSFMTEWHAMDGIESRREDLTSDEKENTELEKTIRIKLREMAMTVDFEEVTSKELRTILEADLNQSLAEFRHFIDEEIVIIFRQMEAPSKIFDYLYLGSEWNASNLEELKNNGVGYIMNVAREIDNFFPGTFKYLNIPVYDTEEADLLKFWDKTYKFISEAKNSGSKVLVHCKMGVSRSASTVVAFAMKEMDWTLDDALKHVLKQRSCVKPNRGFMKQLETYQGILDASKQRHNKLWKTGIQTSTSIRDGADSATSEPGNGNESLVSGIHLLSSPSSNSLMQAQSKTNIIDKSSSSDTASEAEAQDESYSHFLMINRNSASDEPKLCPDFETSSRSESQDDLLSLNLDGSFDSLDEPQDWCKDSAASAPVRLLKYTKVDRDIAGSELVVPREPTANGDSEETLSKDELPCEQGFYDISMLAGYRTNSVYENDDDELFFSGESPLLHPDMILECIQAEQCKKRRIMKLLRRNELLVSMEGSDGGEIGTEGVLKKKAKTSRSMSESSESAPVPPALTKVRPDNSWIRELSEDGSLSTEASPEGAKVDLSEADTMTHSSTPVNLTALLPSSESCIGEGCTCPGDVQESGKDALISVFEDQSCQTQDNESIKLLPTGSVLWNSESLKPGLKSCCTTSVPSHLSKTATELQKSLPESNCTCEAMKAEGGVLRNSESLLSLGNSDEVQKQQATSGSREALLRRPWSIYESEDIPLKPGIVQKTKNEIEMRERSSSSVDLSQGNASTSVHRSHSWKPEQSKSKDRNSKRRQTCHAVLVQSPSATDSLVTPALQHRTEIIQCKSEDKDMAGINTKVCYVGLEELEVAKGSVKRTTKGFEKGLPVALVVSSCEEPSGQCLTSSSVQNGIEVEIGMMRRQTRHIETRYGSQSPLMSRRHLETDLDAQDLEESAACHSAKTGNCLSKREATVPVASVAGRCPGDAFLSPGKALVRRDEQRLHLSLSQKCLSSAGQSFESPDRQRQDLFSAPLDLTKKEMSTRKTHSPMKDETKGIESMVAKQSQVPSRVIQPTQEFSRSSGILRRILSQGNIQFDQLGHEGVCASAESGFSRASSFRETTTSAVKLDDAALSRFNRTGSLRTERQRRSDERSAINSTRPITRSLLSSSNVNFSHVTQPASAKWPLSISRNVTLDACLINHAITKPASTAKSSKPGKDFSVAAENTVCLAPVSGYDKATNPGLLLQPAKAVSDVKISLPSTNLPAEMDVIAESAAESVFQTNTLGSRLLSEIVAARPAVESHLGTSTNVNSVLRHTNLSHLGPISNAELHTINYKTSKGLAPDSMLPLTEAKSQCSDLTHSLQSRNSIPDVVGLKVDKVNKDDMSSEKPESFLNGITTNCTRGVGADCRLSGKAERAASVARGTLMMKSSVIMQVTDQEARSQKEASVNDVERSSGVIQPDANKNAVMPSPTVQKASLLPASEFSILHMENCGSEVVQSELASAVDIKAGSGTILCPECQQIQSEVDCNALSCGKSTSDSSMTDKSSVISVQSTHSSKSNIRFSDPQANSGKSSVKAVDSLVTLLESKRPLIGEGGIAAETSPTLKTGHLEASKTPDITPEPVTASFRMVTGCEFVESEKSLSTSMDLPEEKTSHSDDAKLLQKKSGVCSDAKALAVHTFSGGYSDPMQIANWPNATEEPFNSHAVGLPQDPVSAEQHALPSSDSVHKQRDLDQCHRELVKPQRDLDKSQKPHRELERQQRELENCPGDSGKHCEELEKNQMNQRKDVQALKSACDVEKSHAHLMEEKDQNYEGAAVLLGQKKTVRPANSFSFVKHPVWSEPLSFQPAQSQSVHDETCLSATQTVGLPSTKKLYGKSHPLSRLSTELPMSNWTPST